MSFVAKIQPAGLKEASEKEHNGFMVFTIKNFNEDHLPMSNPAATSPVALRYKNFLDAVRQLAQTDEVRDIDSRFEENLIQHIKDFSRPVKDVHFMVPSSGDSRIDASLMSQIKELGKQPQFNYKIMRDKTILAFDMHDLLEDIHAHDHEETTGSNEISPIAVIYNGFKDTIQKVSSLTPFEVEVPGSKAAIAVLTSKDIGEREKISKDIISAIETQHGFKLKRLITSNARVISNNY